MVTSKDKLVTSRVPAAKSFYAKALSAAEQLSLDEALEVQGLDGEIALLRVRLQGALKEHPEDLELMFKGAALLARLVATKFGLSKGDTDEVQDAIERAVFVLDEMHPEGGNE